MIPKTIHYCWFGKSPMPKLAVKCLASWRKYCPDYEIKEWNEDSTLPANAYTEYCLNNKKWAFLSDYIRLYAVYTEGGIYFDTDVEIIKSFDPLLDCKAFFGFENVKAVNTGHGFGAEAGCEAVFEMMSIYEKAKPDADGAFNLGACPRLNTLALEKFGLVKNGEYQNNGGIVILPSDYLNPYDDPTGVLKKTANTYSIHCYSKSWLDRKTVLRSNLTRPLHRILGKDFFIKPGKGR